MINLQIEPEDSYDRLNGSKEFKRRNRNFGTFEDLKKAYPTNESFLQEIFKVRYAKTNGGCPTCGRAWELFAKIPNKLAYRCRCNNKIYPLKGTHLEHCRTPLLVVLEIFYDLFRLKNGNPATALQRRTGYEYETCWANLHKLSDWMGYSNSKRAFSFGTTIELDLVYPKGKTFLGRRFPFKRSPSSERTFAILMITERDEPERNFRGITKAFCIDKTDKLAIERIVKEHIPSTNKNRIYTDDGGEFSFLSYQGYLQHHYKVIHNDKKYSTEYTDRITGENKICSTNTVEGVNERIKTTIHSVYLGVNPEYMQLYADRVAFNHSNSAKNFFEALAELLNCLPGLNGSVPRKFKMKKRVRNNKIDTSFKEAA